MAGISSDGQANIIELSDDEDKKPVVNKQKRTKAWQVSHAPADNVIYLSG